MSGRLTAEHGAIAPGGGGGAGLLRRISDNVSECTSEQEQSHGFFLSDSSAAETDTGRVVDLLDLVDLVTTHFVTGLIDLSISHTPFRSLSHTSS